jgi:hypothetical protein
LCYFSITALWHLFAAAGLSIDRVEHQPVHGGTVRVFARPEASAAAPDAVAALMAQERAAGLTEPARFRQFAHDVARHRERLMTLLAELQSAGSRIAAYGAPAKGNTLLNYCGITPQLVEYTVDKNPLKVGLFTPGAHLPVLPVETLLERRPEHVLILAWNFADEIVRQQHAFRQQGGRFINPIPVPRIL